MKWMLGWDKLSNQQRQVISDIEISSARCIWVNGFSGSGKTFILIFLIKRFLKFFDGTACFITFTNALRDLVEEVFTKDERNRIEIKNLSEFNNENNNISYDIIAFDEVQDATYNEIKSAYDRTKKLVIAGDFNQQIYENKISNNELSSLVNGHQFYLNTVYRLTEKVKIIANDIYPSSNLKIANYPDNNTMSLKKGSDVCLFKARSEEDEVRNIISKARGKYSPSNPCVILLPSHNVVKKFCVMVAKIDGRNLNLKQNQNKYYNKDFYKDFNKISASTGWDIQYFGNGIGSINDSDFRSLIYIMTYHSSKGLDFNAVFLPFLDKDILEPVLNKYAEKGNDIDKRLLYVVITRTRFDLILSYHNSLSDFFKIIKNNPSVHETSFQTNKTEDNVETDDDLF